MEYRNKVTGIILDFASPISGENWEPVTAPAPEPEKQAEEPKKKAVKKNGRGKG
jgi:hypothetical protein